MTHAEEQAATITRLEREVVTAAHECTAMRRERDAACHEAAELQSRVVEMERERDAERGERDRRREDAGTGAGTCDAALTSDAATPTPTPTQAERDIAAIGAMVGVPHGMPKDASIVDRVRWVFQRYDQLAQEKITGDAVPPTRPHKLTWNGTEWVAPCGCRYHPDDDSGSHGGAPHVHRCESHSDAGSRRMEPADLLGGFAAIVFRAMTIAESQADRDTALARLNAAAPVPRDESSETLTEWLAWRDRLVAVVAPDLLAAARERFGAELLREIDVTEYDPGDPSETGLDIAPQDFGDGLTTWIVELSGDPEQYEETDARTAMHQYARAIAAHIVRAALARMGAT